MELYELKAEDNKYVCFRNGKPVPTHTHFHGAIEFLFVQEGEVQVTLDHETVTLHKGDACFSDSFCLHAYHAENPNATAVFVFLGDKTLFERVFATLGGIPPKFFRFDNIELLSRLCDLYTQNEGGRYATFEGCAYIILAEIARVYPFQPRKENKQTFLVCQTLRYAQEHYKDDLSLNALARVFGYSKEHLSRLLGKYLKENWNHYVARIRVRKAHEHLLAQPNTSVLDIAIEHGFESANTFYRAYKREYGTLPRRN